MFLAAEADTGLFKEGAQDTDRCGEGRVRRHFPPVKFMKLTSSEMGFPAF